MSTCPDYVIWAINLKSYLEYHWKSSPTCASSCKPRWCFSPVPRRWSTWEDHSSTTRASGSNQRQWPRDFWMAQSPSQAFPACHTRTTNAPWSISHLVSRQTVLQIQTERRDRSRAIDTEVKKKTTDFIPIKTNCNLQNQCYV